MAQVTIQISGSVTTIQLEPRQFKTGSKGYYGSGKITSGEGKYQVSINAVLVGSKPANQQTNK